MYDYSEKPKRKSDESAGPLDSLLIFLGAKPTPFEFTAEESIGLCTTLLKAKDQRPEFLGSVFGGRRIEVNIYQIDDANCEFNILKKQNRHLPILLTGRLQRMSNSSTLITGVAQTQHMLVQLLIPLAVFVLFFLSVGLARETSQSARLIFIGWIIFVIGVNFAISTSDRYAFIRLIKSSLTKIKDDWD